MGSTNDNNVPFGSQVVTVFSGGATGVGFVAENITYKEPTNIIERMDELGSPSGQVLQDAFANGSATLQFATTLTVAPTRGTTFIMTRNGGATVLCMVSETDEPETQKDAKKCQINFRKKYGP